MSDGYAASVLSNCNHKQRRDLSIMVMIDYLAKNAFGRADVFADLFNGLAFGGERVIKPENLSDVPCAGMIKVNGRFMKVERDIVKRLEVEGEGNDRTMLLGVEVQAYMDTMMPFRVFAMDNASYYGHLKKLASDNKAHKRLKGDSLMSGFLSDDRAVPVLTVVINLTGEKWSAGDGILDMMDFRLDPLKRLVRDYRMVMITPSEMSDDEIMLYGRDVATLLFAAKYAKDKEAFFAATKELGEICYDMAQLVNKVGKLGFRLSKKEKIDMTEREQTYVQYLRHKIRDEIRNEIHDKIRDEAYREGEESGFKRGEIEGQIKGVKIGQIKGEIKGTISTMNLLSKTKMETCNLLMKQYNYTRKEAMKSIDEMTMLTWPFEK